jgi:hypothetical protein
MNNHTPQKQRRRFVRYLALAGLTVGLTVPFSASAHTSDNGAMEVLVSAGIAYAVIDAAGGFDKHRHNHRHEYGYNDRYRHRDGYRYENRYRWDDHSHKGFHKRPNGYAWGHDPKRCKVHKHFPERRGHDRHDYRFRAYH